MTPETNPLEFSVQVIIDEDGDGFHAYCPALKGLHVGGHTFEEARQNAEDAVIAHLRSLIKHGDPIPLGVQTKEVPVPHRRHHEENLVVSAA